MKSKNTVFVFTLFSSLGDFILIGDLVHKIERLLPTSRVVVAHRNNPYVKFWKYANASGYFYNVTDCNELLKFHSALRKLKADQFTILGLQQAPGSLQGFFFYALLKKIKAIDYIVDFNLYNADIVTRPDGKYILDLHLNQIKNLANIQIPNEYYQLNLPFEYPSAHQGQQNSAKVIGIHPWSRRGHLPAFAWPRQNWRDLIQRLAEDQNNQIVIFGRDAQFEDFKNDLHDIVKEYSPRISFQQNTSIQDLTTTIDRLDLLISVNTSVVHIGYALNKKMVILSGPTFDFWIPKGENIKTIQDDEAMWPGSDKHIYDDHFPSIQRIPFEKVLSATNELLKCL